MYILKNAMLSIKRCYGRSILLGIIICIIAVSSCISLTIKSSSDILVDSYIEDEELVVSFEIDRGKLQNASNVDKNNFSALDVSLVKEIANSSLVSDYYYTLEVSMSSDAIDCIDDSFIEVNDDDNKKRDNNGFPNKFSNMGDYRFTAYSNFSYLEDFVNGTKKIIEGEFLDNDSSKYQLIISEDLSQKNNLTVGDTVKFYYPSNSKKTYKFTVVGIYSDTSNNDDFSFMPGNLMNASNQIYTNISSISKILSDNPSSDVDGFKRISNNDGLKAKFILSDDLVIDQFKDEALNKGLSSYYSLVTNQEEILNSLKPIKNISNFSLSFLVLTLIVGAIVIIGVNIINIRDRKYEIGVLRAIGMSKFHIILQLVSEMFIVSLISLVIGISIGTLSSQGVTNKMLEKEISSYQSDIQSIQDNFGGQDKFSFRPKDNRNTLNMFMNSSNNYIDKLIVSTDFKVLAFVFLISLVLTIISCFISVSFISRYEPNKILQNRI